MQLTVHLDTTNADDQAALLRLIGNVEGTVVTLKAATVEPVEEPEETPAPKRTRAPRTTKPKAPEPVEETPEEDEDLLGDDGPSFADKLKEAKERASVLVAARETDAVKDALLTAKAKRVTELTEANIDQFLGALPDAD